MSNFQDSDEDLSVNALQFAAKSHAKRITRAMDGFEGAPRFKSAMPKSKAPPPPPALEVETSKVRDNSILYMDSVHIILPSNI